VKTSPKRSYSVIENERFGLVFAKTRPVVSGCGFDLIPVENFATGINDDVGSKFATGVNSRMPHNSMNSKKRRNTSYCMDANIRRDYNISGKW
jgi:hypothetical protein